MSLYAHVKCPENCFYICTNPECINGGCVRQRPWTFTPMPRGCVCPPTSEQTCQNPDCGRKPPRNALTSTPAPSEKEGEGL